MASYIDRVYADLVRKDKKKLEDIPEGNREAVKAILIEWGIYSE